MPFKKNEKCLTQTIILEVPADSDLLFRIKKIVAQTGLDPLDLFRKWVLQEEALIGLVQYNKNQVITQVKPQRASDKEAVDFSLGEIDPGSPDYRKVLIKKVQELKAKDTALIKIAEIFNKAKLPTVSGKGKWYSSSINNLLTSSA